jgi:hypothetical protein
MDECEKIAEASARGGVERVNFKPGEGSTVHGGAPAKPPAQHPIVQAMEKNPAMQRMTGQAPKQAPVGQLAQK